MFKNILFLIFCFGLINAAKVVKPPKQEWNFYDPAGTFDRAALQRGFQVYKEVCASCHGIKYIAFRHLKALGLNEGEIKSLAASYEITDGPNDDGEMFQRPGLASDYLPEPYTNEKQARAANGGAYPPDLSLIIKSRIGGADYLYGLLTGYTKPPADFDLPEGKHYNKYYPGHAISMTAPLSDDLVTYNDDTKPTLNQMARDVTTFLAWAAEPELESRKRAGISVLLYLTVMTVLFYFLMRRIWAKVKK